MLGPPGTVGIEAEPEAAAALVALGLEPSASQLDVFKRKLRLLIDGNTSDFDTWVSLISSAEETSVNDIGVISLVYRTFLLEFPLCYGYWIKYAAHKARLCTYDDVVGVYEQAVQAVPHCTDLWVSYCGFAMSAYEDPALIRSLFERAVSLVGKDYLCCHLWDKYIEFEKSQKQLIQLATIYINMLKFPTKKLHKYYGSFKKLATSLEQEVTHCGAEISPENLHTFEAMEAEESEGYISSKGSVLFDQGGHLKPEALKQYLIAGERFYQRSSELDKEICGFETSIKRPFFHVKPLDDDQLENWNLYLDFVEKNGDFDWAVKLYERCLIPCANYSEFWIRYAEYVDAKGGREIANYALGRASSFFVKGVPSFNMYYSIFKEQIGDAPGARSLFVEGSSNFTSDFCMNINRLANMEKRMGNTKAATEIYENAIQDAMQKQNTEVLPDLYTNFAQFKYAASHSIDGAKEVFVKGIKQAPCKPLIKFVDLYGGVQELRKAWARHSKLFPHNTRNPSQQYCTPDCNKRRITEFLRVAHDCSREGTITLKQSPKSETCSWLVDKEVGSQVDMDAVNSAEGQGYGEQNIVGCVDAQQEVGDTAHSQHSLDKYGIQSQMFSHASQDISHDLTVCEQIDQTTICHASVSEKAAQAESCNYDSPSNSIADPKQIDAQDKIKAIELSAVDHHPGAVCSRSEPLSGTHLLKGSPSGPTPIFSELENKQLEKIQVKLETEHDVSVSNAKPERSSDNPEATECAMEVSALSQDHIQSSQTQDLSVCAKTSSSEMAITQITTCSQFSPDNAVTAQAPLQHHMDNSQTYQSINLFLTGQNMQQMQQQGPAYAISQNIHTSPHSQVHPVAQPNQGNQQYMEMMQGYASQMWQYYQQQLYHLQTQHNQQIQSLQQQQLPTEHLQQSFTQQVQQLNQQMVLWQQQVQQQQLQQQQHAQQVQQQSDKTQGDIHSSSGDTKCEQNKHQQQESEIDHQSQKFQQQQLLYFQQQQQVYFIQQQQQMYQQQQQQQQQLMQQQQYLSQMPQQAQDVEQQQQLFQQQQQQLYDQQQKQMVVLQQQQQQFAQQQMQQYLQQQANQQVFKDQNCELSHQDARKRQLEHGQQSEASQSDGSKLRSGEQSELSYPSTPQSQCSSH
ncbi:polyhomeotic-proximal chromatin protein isoform X2 [Hordeum vulgare subsp. vulgare]|uniref:polyhomeotic-proximal chromatin protein isoform X2 n=2 Tax=Hordeum vulgare subsp. vulgare TaxID=112509 RepID=UPI001D1A350B|nr:polyhomeotic-proximal chromatin protein isoform X2 [Hordeum vulgare subsp. vulgare]